MFGLCVCFLLLFFVTCPDLVPVIYCVSESADMMEKTRQLMII